MKAIPGYTLRLVNETHSTNNSVLANAVLTERLKTAVNERQDST